MSAPKTTGMSALDVTLSKAERYLARFRAEGVLNHIAGEAVPAVDGTTFETISPIDLGSIAKVAWGKMANTDRAAKAAFSADALQAGMIWVNSENVRHLPTPRIDRLGSAKAAFPSSGTGQANVVFPVH